MELDILNKAVELIKKQGHQRSMSRKGCSPDNVTCEGFFSRLKNEMYYGRDWPSVELNNFMQHVDIYIRWYNEQRIKLSQGAISPERYRQQLEITQ